MTLVSKNICRARVRNSVLMPAPMQKARVGYSVLYALCCCLWGVRKETWYLPLASECIDTDVHTHIHVRHICIGQMHIYTQR